MQGSRTGTLRVPGASLSYEVRGSGRVLLVLQGGDGDAGGTAALAAGLVDHATVVTYDRRGLTRSPVDGGAGAPTIETHADDAHRLLAAVTTEPALVFGGGLGALVGLDLAVRHPEQVRALVAHEPPAAWLLPDPERADAERAPGGVEAGAARADRPDRAALGAARTRIVPAAGAASRGTWFHRCAEALAELVGTPVAEFPGGHDGFVTHPRAFAARLREAFGGAPAERRRQALHGLRAPRGAAEYDAAYAGGPAWDIGRPQPAFLALAEAGAVRGRVLDVGCGTGEHALMAAGLGLDATGVDLSAVAVDLAKGKAAARGLPARFLVLDVLDLSTLGERFDTVLDSGLSHVLSDADRVAFVAALGAVVPPGGRCFLLCFSDLQPGSFGPRRITRDEILTAFADGWRVESVEPATMDITVAPTGARAWLATITRT